MKSNSYNLSWLFCAIMMFCAFFIIFNPSISFADDTGSGIFGTQLCAVVGLFKGKIAIAIASMAIIALGLLALAGKLPWQMVAVIIVAILIMLNAESIVTLVAGKNAGTVCPTDSSSS
ncbi:MAG: TrbC/VirB2 family protein [Rickettsiaceae bacterium]